MHPTRFHRLCDAWSRRESRLDRRVAMIAAVVANCNRTKETPPFEIKDFMPQMKKTAEERARDEARRTAAAIAEAFRNGE